MTVSFSLTVPVTCEHCETRRTEDVFIIVSGIDRPDLINQSRDGLFPGFFCRTCMRVSSLDTGLLIHRPDQGGLAALIFVPPYVATSEEANKMAGDLVAILFDNLGLSGQNVSVRIFAVYRLALPAVLRRDIGSDLRVPANRLRLPPDIPPAYREMLNELRKSLDAHRA